MTSVLVVDDHPLVLQGCARVLGDGGFAPVYAASDVISGYRLYLRHRPAVAIIDLAIRGKGLAGLALMRRVKAHDPDARMLVLSMFNEANIVVRSLEAGATGYILKDSSSEELVEAVRQVAAGGTFLGGDLSERVSLADGSPKDDSLAALTPRELQVLALLADANNYDRIADELSLTYKTVANISSQLKRKLNAHSLGELVSAATKLVAPRNLSGNSGKSS
jgi:two-component system, NarL family, invasion response regulator UvrY